MQRRFGFSRFAVETVLGRYGVGRLGKAFFRLEASEAWFDPGVHAVLRDVEPRGQLLLRGAAPEPELEIAHHAVRLTMETEALLERLAARVLRSPGFDKAVPENSKQISVERRGFVSRTPGDSSS